MEKLSVDDIGVMMPRPFLPGETDRCRALIDLSYERIEFEFARRGLVLRDEIVSKPWLITAVKIVVRTMVVESLLTGVNINMVSVSSTTGEQSDSATFAKTGTEGFGGVFLTERMLHVLGLLHIRPRYRGGDVVPFPESKRVNLWSG